MIISIDIHIMSASEITLLYTEAKIFIQKIYKKTKKKTYSSIVFMKNYREDGKVKHHIISNLSRWPEGLVSGLEKLIKDQEINSVNDLKLSTDKSFGAILTVSEIAKQLGIKQALGNSKQAELASYGYNRDKKRGKKQIVIRPFNRH